MAIVKRPTETTLSTDLSVITAEIKSYQQVAGHAIFEIGMRLKYVKENDLTHGQFGKWLEDVGIHQRTAQQMMKVASDESLKTSTYSHFGLKALELIATIPEEERSKTHVIRSTGKEKAVEEMTVRELREVKKALKEAEERERTLRDTLEYIEEQKRRTVSGRLFCSLLHQVYTQIIHLVKYLTLCIIR